MRRTSNQRGSVLVLTLWLAAGLAEGALLAGHVAVLRYRRDAAQYAAACIEHATEGARRYVEQVLTSFCQDNELPDPDLYTAQDIRIGECRVWLLGRSADKDASEPTFGLQDEAGRLNLNLARTRDTAAVRSMLEALPGMTPDLAGAILDWCDDDDEVSPDGAESETYLTRTPPSMAKNAPFESVDELRLLHGAEPWLLDGLDRNRNSLIESWEKERRDAEKERFREVPDFGLLDLCTVYSRQPAAPASGAAGPTASPGSGAPGGQPPGTNPGAGAQTTVECPVNIITAPEAVLACLPGVGEDGAAQIVRYREQNSGSLHGTDWLAAALGREVPEARPYITGRTYQAAADVVVVGPKGRAFRRTRFVFDLTGGAPVLISRRDLTHLGWPLGAALHASLRTNGRPAE